MNEVYSETRIDSVRAEIDLEIQHAKDAYATHRIVKESSGRWLCKAADNSNSYWFEVIVLAGHRLFVHGDFDPILFAQYYPLPGTSEEELLRSTLRWMANTPRPDYGYFISKAILGSGEAAVMKSEDTVLRAQIAEMIEEYRTMEVEDTENVEETILSLEEALQMVDGHHTHDEVKRFLYEALNDAEALPDGKRISLGMVFAHAALQKLESLLKEREV